MKALYPPLLDPAELPERPFADPLLFGEPHVVVVGQGAFVVDVPVRIGDPVGRPHRLHTIWTETHNVAVVHEDLDGSGLVEVLWRTTPQMQVDEMRLANAERMNCGVVHLFPPFQD